MSDYFMRQKILLLAGNRGHKIKDPLATIDLRVTEINTEQLKWRAKLRAVLELYRCLLMKDAITISDHAGYFSLVALIGSRLVSSPFILRLRGDTWRLLPQLNKGWRLRLRLAIAKYIIYNADLTISVSKFLADRIINRFDILPEKVVTIPIPVNRRIEKHVNELPSHVQELLNQVTDQQIILTVTNLRFSGKLHGLTAFLPIFVKVVAKRRDVLWLIAGSGQYLAEFQNEVRKRSWLTNKVHLLGYVTPIEPLVDRADLVVYFSDEDGFPNVVLEAQVAGKPVIVNNFDPFLEQVHHGHTGFVVDPTEIDQVSELICDLLNDAALRFKIGNQAQLSALQHFNEHTIGKMFEEAFNNLLNQRLKKG